MEAAQRGEVFISGSVEQLMKDLNTEDLPDYPAETEGSILAREARVKANSLTTEA